jgi:hypothetical protein
MWYPYFPNLEIYKADIVVQRTNFLIASTVCQLRQTLFKFGDELGVY